VTFEWAVDRSGYPALPELPDDPTDDEQIAYDAAVVQQNAAENLAVQIMWSLSGRQFGLATHIVRPCRLEYEFNRREMRSYYDLLWFHDGGYFSGNCGCSGRCSLSGHRAVHLPGPVHDITTVTLGGEVLDPSGYTVENNVLYRAGGRWPRQDLSKPLDENGTWSVTYRRGIELPQGVPQYTGILTKEILLALADNAKCRLPRRVETVSRQGVSYKAYDPTVLYANGKTGLAEVDLWLAAINPHALMAAPTVL
jgi:hypothetical protein